MKHLILENKTPVGKEILDGQIMGTIYQTEDGKYVGGEYEYQSLGNYYCLGDDGKAHKLTVDDEQREYTCDDGYIPDGRFSADGDYFSSFSYQDPDTEDYMSVKVMYAEDGASSRTVRLAPANEFLTDDDDNDITATTVTCLGGELTESEMDIYDGDGYYSTNESNAALYGKYEDTGERRTLTCYGRPYLAFVFRKVSNSQLYFGLEETTNLGYKQYMLATYSASTTPSTTASTSGSAKYYNVVKKDNYMKSAYPGVAYNIATKECAYNPMKPSLNLKYEISGSGVQESTKFDVDHTYHVRYQEYTYAECGITQSVIESYRKKIRDGHYVGEDFNIVVNGLYPNLMRTDNSTYMLFHCGRSYVLFDDENQRISVGVSYYYSM